MGFEDKPLRGGGNPEANHPLACVPGAPIPTAKGPPDGSAGVVSITGTVRSCVGICSAAVPDDGTGWGWEFEASCVIRGSATAVTSVPCTIGAPVPTTMGPPANSPGVVSPPPRPGLRRPVHTITVGDATVTA